MSRLISSMAVVIVVAVVLVAGCAGLQGPIEDAMQELLIPAPHVDRVYFAGAYDMCDMATRARLDREGLLVGAEADGTVNEVCMVLARAMKFEHFENYKGPIDMPHTMP